MTAPARRTPPHRHAVAALPVLAAALLTLGTPPTADAQTTDTADTAQSGYRYWSFWEREDGSWSFATQGPSVLRPEDGAVLGLRFAVSEDSSEAARPRGAADFAAVCADTKPESGGKRVALVLDFGTAADARAGETPPKNRTACARISDDASAGDALAAVAKPLRYNSAALLCAIDGYPESGCGEQISGKDGGNGKTEDADDRSAGSGSGGDGGLPTALGVVAGIGAVLVLTAGTLWQTRRRRG